MFTRKLMLLVHTLYCLRGAAQRSASRYNLLTSPRATSKKFRQATSLYHVVTPGPRSFHYSPDDTGGAAHSCAAGHTTYDKKTHG